MLNKMEILKIKIMCSGIKISKRAEKKLTNNGLIPLSLFEYPTTAGISLVLPGEIYVNSQFSGKFKKSEILLDYENDFFLIYKNEEIKISVIPLPAFYNKKNEKGLNYSNIIMSHTDRMRISPINGCNFSCKYCDYNQIKYKKHSFKDIKEAIDVALKDKNIKPRHLLISGGTPKPEDKEYLLDIYKETSKYLTKKGIPVDVMCAPIFDLKVLKQIKKMGINGLSINIEIYNRSLAKKLNPEKYNLTLKYYIEFIKEAVKIFGKGKIRSILIVGLDSIDDTLKGVEKIASIGSDVVLSPFVPSPKTELFNLKPPSEKQLIEVYEKSLEIVKKYGTEIGPRCLPCQHNTLAFPKR
jgi:biotin synthase-related radical SAM superfamily protein